MHDQIKTDQDSWEVSRIGPPLSWFVQGFHYVGFEQIAARAETQPRLFCASRLIGADEMPLTYPAALECPDSRAGPRGG